MLREKKTPMAKDISENYTRDIDVIQCADEWRFRIDWVLILFAERAEYNFSKSFFKNDMQTVTMKYKIGSM